MSNSQLNKLKSAIKNGTEVNFPHKLLLTNRQVANIRKAFANHTSTDIKLSKAQLTKMQKGGFLIFLVPLLKSGLPLLKSVIKPLGMLGLYWCCISNRYSNKQKKSLDLEIMQH